MRPRSSYQRVVLGALATVALIAGLTAVALPAGAATRTQATATTATRTCIFFWCRKTATPTPAPTSSTSTTTTAPPPTTTPPTTTTPPPPTTSADTTPPAITQPCGDTVYKVDGTPWVCSFDDEFDGTSLDRTKWSVQTTATSGYHSGAECFVDSPNNVAVSDGTLKLTVRQESAPFTCKKPLGSYATQYTSGTVNSSTKFSQTYGRFEVRAKLPDTAIKGLQETLWLWPDNSTKYGLWPLSGEIDFGEFYSQYSGWNIPYLHYGLLQSTVSWLTNTNVYTALPAPNNQPGMACSYDKTGFNTYTATWAPGQITLQVNGQNCIIDNYSATNLTGAAPFDQPFFIALTQMLGVGTNLFVNGTTPLPATTEVDYVRIWK